MGGNFLSQPKRDGPGECDTDPEVNLSYGVTGVQGWRLSMEDAHLCIPRLNKLVESDADLKAMCKSTESIPDCSLFAVFDGHGGQEVATLCSRKFVQFLLKEDAFFSGDYEQALRNVYMSLDRYVISDEGQQTLQDIIEEASQNGDDDEDEDDLEEDELDEEKGKDAPEDDSNDEEEDDDDDDDDDDGQDKGAEEDGEDDDDDDDEGEGAESAEGAALLINSLMNNDFMTFLAKRTQQMRNELSALEDDEDDEDFDPEEVTEEDHSGEEEEDDENSEEDHEEEEGAKEKEKVDEKKDGNTSKDDCIVDEMAGEIDAEGAKQKSMGKHEGADSKAQKKSEEVSNGGKEVVPNGESKGSSGEEESPVNGSCNGHTDGSSGKASRKKNNPKKLKFEDAVDSNGDEVRNSKSQIQSDTKYEELVNEDSSEDEPLLGFGDDNPLMQKPGYDSGCTAVVALKVQSRVFVANAGDSRCVLCRGEKGVVPLSFDHTPAVREEVERVLNAGGIISAGRVDGGLNLTRAIGDHRYKQNAELTAEKQRISCEPEVTVTEVNSSDGDEVLVIACDGVWECLQNEQVNEFVSSKLTSCDLFQISQQLAQKCIASDCRQATGLDNVTAVIVTLKAHERTKQFRHVPISKRKAQQLRMSSSTGDEKSDPSCDALNPQSPGDKTESHSEEVEEMRSNGDTKEVKCEEVKKRRGEKDSDSVSGDSDEQQPSSKVLKTEGTQIV